MVIDKERIKKFKDKVRQMTPRNSGWNLSTIIRWINPVLRGWSNYFRVSDCKGVFQALMEWIRRRLRMKKMREWKKWKAFHKQLRRVEFKGEFPKISMTRWRNSCCFHIHKALSNNWFKEQGLYDITVKPTGVLFNYYE